MKLEVNVYEILMNLNIDFDLHHGETVELYDADDIGVVMEIFTESYTHQDEGRIFVELNKGN